MQADRRTAYALVVDDHPLVADSVVACVRDCAPWLVVEVADSLAVALRILASRGAPLLIVTDLTLPDSQGAASVRRLSEAAPLTPMLVFTALDEPILREEANQAGVRAYLIKNSSAQTLRDEMRAVLGEETAGSRTASQRSDPASLVLTPKQIAVLDELASGRSNKEIAVRLNISDETVGSHMKEILGRLGAKNRTEAVVRYLQLTDQQQNQRRRGER